MSNWFQDHPITSVITHTVIVSTATWAFSFFILDENKINFYKAQAVSAQSQINNEKTISEQYKAKVSVLEQQVSRLKSENDRYLSWLSQEENSFPSLKKKIELLEANIKTEKEKICVSKPLTSMPLEKLDYKPYLFKQSFEEGESFTDPKTFATIGVSDVTTDYTANGIINIPGKGNIEIKNAKPGESWTFEKDGKQFRLTLDSVNWINNSVKASVQEIKSKEFSVTSGSK